MPDNLHTNKILLAFIKAMEKSVWDKIVACNMELLELIDDSVWGDALSFPSYKPVSDNVRWVEAYRPSSTNPLWQ